MRDLQIARRRSNLLVIAFVAGATLWSGPRLAQTSSAADAVAEVRTTHATARKELDTYKAAGGALGVPEHPAVKWDAALWACRERYPRSEAAAIASTAMWTLERRLS